MVLCSNFKGCCTYPIGGYISSALLLSTLCAMGATIYGVVSCTFVSITFQSDNGNFEDYFTLNNDASDNINADTDNTNDNIMMTYKVGTGLFQWLRPASNFNYSSIFINTDTSNTTDTIQSNTTTNTNNNINNNVVWTDGTCIGYTQTMLQMIGESENGQFFDISRSFGIASVLISIFMTIWSFLSACMDWNCIQICLLSGINFLGTLFTGLTFLYMKSSLCTDSLFTNPTCQTENGGLIMISATILWLFTFIMSIVFINTSNTISSATANNKRIVEKDNAKYKADMERSIARKKTLQSQSKSVPNGDIILQKNSYSFDSQSNWHKPIPSRNRTHSYEGPTSRNVQKIPNAQSYDEGAKKQNQPQSQQAVARSLPSPAIVPLRTLPPNGSQQQQHDIESAIPRQQQSYQPTRNRSSSLPPNMQQQRSTITSSGGPTVTTLRSIPVVNNNNPKKKKLLIVDDISEADTMEIYIKQRLDKIEALTDDVNDNNNAKIIKKSQRVSGEF